MARKTILPRGKAHAQPSHRQATVYHGEAYGAPPYTMPRYAMACHDVDFRHRPGRAGHGRAEPAVQRHQADDRETEAIENQNAEGSEASNRRACQVKVIWTNIEKKKSS